MVYDYQGNLIDIKPSIVGDGVADDTEALQALVDNFSEVYLSGNLRIKVTDTIEVDPATCHFIGGRNCTILPVGDITVFHIQGSMTSSMNASPRTLDENIMNNEGGFTICGLRIQGSETGTAIEIDACFKANVKDCYIHHMKKGIVISNQCRDFEISGNHIYATQLYSIEVASNANIHQCNIENNIINYAKYLIYINKARYIANFQIVGNDLEVNGYAGGSGGYPSGSVRDFRCIVIDAQTDSEDDVNPFSEIEIVGNTMQGHGGCDHVIEMLGDASPSRTIKDMNITGNHISMSYGDLIALACINGINISGNTIRESSGYAIHIGANCTIVSITGNNCGDSAGFVKHTGSTNRLIVANNISQTDTADPYHLIGSNIQNGIIEGNVLSGSNTGMTVNPTSVTRVMVANNIVGSGSYTLHSSVVANNNM